MDTQSSINHWRSREARGGDIVLKTLSSKIQAMPCKDGTILCRLGDLDNAYIQFRIDAGIVMEAAHAAAIFAEELAKKELPNVGSETASQSAGGE